MEREQLAGLVRKAQDGDQEAMNRLLEVTYKSVIFQCRRIMAHPEDAEDMAQEVVLRVYETLDTLREPEHFLSWANCIAARRCINERKRNPKDLQFAEDEEGHSILDSLEELDRQSVPDAALDQEETQRMVVELIDALPEAQRAATYLYYYDEMSVKEIAQLLSVPENTVKSRLNYARKAIKEGVLDYEKKGIKIYGLSPLPFLRFLLRRAAETGESTAAAQAAAQAALASGAAAAGTAASVSAASGTAAETAGAGAAASAGTAGTAGGSAAAGAAAAAGTGAGASAAGLLGGLSVKVVAGVLAGALVVGGGAAILTRQEEQAPPPASSQSEEVPDPQPVDPDAPVELAAYTMRRTTVVEEAEIGFVGIYLETPLFEEVNEGYPEDQCVL